MKVELMKTNEVKPYGKNPRINKEAVDYVANSIKEFGFKNPIIIDKDNVIIAGHTRLKAAKKLKLKEVPAIRAEDLTKEQVKAFRIADNKTAEYAKWDHELLITEMQELKASDYNLEMTGFSIEELSSMPGLDSYIEEDEGLEDNYEEQEDFNSFIEKGDLILLGDNRLLCGDTTIKEDMEKLMNGKLADLVITDPPYNVKYEGKTNKKMKIKNDDMNDDDFYNFLYKFFKNTFDVMEEGASIYVFFSDTEIKNFANSFHNSGFKFSQLCHWVKNRFVLGRKDYHVMQESIIYGWKLGKAHNWYNDRKQTTIWNFDRTTINDLHPTMKPIELINYPMKNSSKKGDIVLDPFGGSGSTLIAAVKSGRICYTIELDEKYASTIVDRYIKFKESSQDVFIIRNGNKYKYEEIN